jgi:hypothetical protein
VGLAFNLAAGPLSILKSSEKQNRIVRLPTHGRGPTMAIMGYNFAPFMFLQELHWQCSLAEYAFNRLKVKMQRLKNSRMQALL